MRIEEELFKIIYEEEKNTIFFEGSLRLNDLARFEKIKQFMLDVYGLETKALILDFLKLDFLNSAGISTLCNFIFEIKDQNKKSVAVRGNKNIQWQNKSFANLKIIWDKIDVSFQ